MNSKDWQELLVKLAIPEYRDRLVEDLRLFAHPIGIHGIILNPWTFKKIAGLGMASEDGWELESIVVPSSAKNARTVVSVAFSIEEFEEVSKAAKAKGLKTSTYIRGSILASQRPQPFIVSLTTEATFNATFYGLG